ncbi:lysis system i-spanin subunit Rz [Pseudomonas sp. OV226]|uniref:lysis system i-spanin subunit Rz n=1 Tax=Pseudomonas sp. OV226 TaxID=2135588 RepID=UPI000D6CF831|nr:lysis system i-spanin subunit Rz [Pseudomonas sp. OV226]PWK30842.1 bacteriophage Rz lysis protein [Pseudomonas sp. OV226]
MTAVPWKLVGALALALVAAGSAWRFQDWRYGKQLAEQAGLHQVDLTAISNAAAAQMRADQDKRLVLEQRLTTSDQTHHKELTDAQTDQARLRDRLATSDLRLSVLLDTTDPASGCSMPAGTEAVGVVHGGARARLDPAHAQRIVAITDAGDQGLIALKACQAYAREVSTPK